MTADTVLERLKEHGLLLKQDKRALNVVTLVTGESLSTSWWSHPKGREIFAILGELIDHRDVVLTKLLSRKDTFVHRRLWPALLAVSGSRAPWQLSGLSADARRLLSRVEKSP